MRIRAKLGMHPYAYASHASPLSCGFVGGGAADDASPCRGVAPCSLSGSAARMRGWLFWLLLLFWLLFWRLLLF